MRRRLAHHEPNLVFWTAATGYRAIDALLLQRQDTSCTGPLGNGLADTRVLGVYVLNVANGQAAHTKLPLETRPEWSDLGGGGWVHPTKPWLYLGSKHSQRIYAYAVDEAAGTVQPIAGSPFEVQPLPNGDGVFVACAGHGPEPEVSVSRALYEPWTVHLPRRLLG